MSRWEQIQKLLLLKVRYATASASATVVDYALWFLLTGLGTTATLAHFISYPVGVLLNFYFQRKYIFSLRRKLRHTFLMAMSISAIGWWAGTALIALLLQVPFFAATPILAKLLVNCVLFLYNFYLKRFAFEKRFVEVD